MPEAAFDLARAQRWFAVEINNQAWDLVEAPSRTPQQTEQMLHAAHGAYLHWLAIGQPINELRALCLLSTVYAAAQNAVEAGRYARRCVALTEQNPDGLSPFDQATAYGAAALAYKLSEDRSAAEKHRAKALGFAAAIPADDRAIFENLYS